MWNRPRPSATLAGLRNLPTLGRQPEGSPVNREPMRKRTALVGLGLSAVLLSVHARPARADVKLPAIFGPHMVLQRDQKDRVWGKADPGEEVTVTVAEQSRTAKADD